MNALWWWIDRWRKSTAYTDMTLEQQGAYRNLLDEANLRGGALPDDDRVLAKACGDVKVWRRVRPVVMARFVLRPDGWHNETLDAVIHETERRATNQANYRSRRDNKPNNKPDNKPDSPYPYPSPDLSKRSVDPSPDVQPPPVLTSPGAADARSKRPIFKGERFVVFEWQFDDLRKMLGTNFDAFDIHSWFYELEKRATREGLVIPQRDGGVWLAAQTLAEAQKRGLPIATTAAPNALHQSMFGPGTSSAELAAGAKRVLAERGK